MAPLAPCQVCGEPGRNGKAPNKYCDRHIMDGRAAGHIKRPHGDASSSSSASTQSGLPDGWKVLSIKSIIDARCAYESLGYSPA